MPKFMGYYKKEDLACSACGYTGTQTGMRLHFKMKHNITTPKKKTDDFIICAICNERFKTEAGLLSHMEIKKHW